MMIQLNHRQNQKLLFNSKMILMKQSLSTLLVLFLSLFDLTNFSFARNEGFKPRGPSLRSRYESLESSRHHQIKYNASSSANLSPVILIPGDGGSRLQAKLDRNQVLHYYCEKKTNDWFDLWLNLSLLVPFALECWMDNMRLVYNETTRQTSSPPGVNIRVDGFGKAESVEFVDPARVRGTSYFDSLVKQLINLGYERDINVFGAPYDFRKAPNELESYFNDLTGLIEHAFTSNNNEKVVLICHSLGCYNSLYYLQLKEQSWKEKHIRFMISLAGAWGGSVKALKAFTSGDNFGVVVVPSLSLRRDFRTFPSMAYLLPSKHVWPKNQILLQHSGKNYTVDDYEEFFNDIDYPVGYQMWLDTKNLTWPNMVPNIEVFCLHGAGIDTVENLKYSSSFPDGKPDIEYGLGDGTVNSLSLELCSTWQNHQKQPVHYKSFPKIDHMSIMSDNDVLEFIGDALSKND